MNRFWIGMTLVISSLLWARCVPPPAPTATPTAAPSATPQPTATPTPAPTFTPSPTPPPTATPTPVFKVSSPLEGISLSQIPKIISNPLDIPKAGQDDGHHGVDLAYWRFGDKVGMLGLPVFSVLDGKVVGVVPDRNPYGNALIIETPFEKFPADLANSLALPPVQPTAVPSLYHINCPPAPQAAYGNPNTRSIYLLYAHFNKPPLVKAGDAVTSGQQIGEVGTSGASVNPHLHLEMRIGPGNATFTSMAHYKVGYTDEEMATYCLWRITNLYQITDPLKLLLPRS